MCVDYRELNAITEREYFPTPNIEEQLNSLAGKKLFTILDLMSGYYQVPVAIESRQYPVICDPGGSIPIQKNAFWVDKCTFGFYENDG